MPEQLRAQSAFSTEPPGAASHPVVVAHGFVQSLVQLAALTVSKDPPTKVSLLEVFVWFPTSEIMLLSQQVASGRYEGQSEGGLLSR